MGMVSQEKWENNQRLIREVREIIEAGTKMHRPILDSIWVFLVYLARTYQDFNHNLKGIHLTIDSWRPERYE